MYLGRVVGTVVAERKPAALRGIKLLVVQPLTDALTPSGDPQVAADATGQAGPQDLVSLVGSREASLAFEDTFVPVDAAIIGIVDQVHRVATSSTTSTGSARRAVAARRAT